MTGQRTHAAVITVSDRCSAGTAEDRSGPAIVEMLRDGGLDCADPVVVPDGADSVELALRAAIDQGARVVVTTGGTGVGPRDATPEGTRRVLSEELPGLVEEMRRVATRETPGGMLSRGLAGVARTVDRPAALVVNLPGSRAAVTSAVPILLTVLQHAVAQLDGSGH